MKKTSTFWKTSVLVVLLAFFSITKVQAQAAILVLIFGDKAATENFNFSIIGGLNYSQIDNRPNTLRLVAPNFGLGINIKLNDKLYFKPEFKPLNQKGFKYTSSSSSGIPAVDSSFMNVSTSVNMNYIDVPLLMYYQVSNKLQFGIGPQINFLTSAKKVYKDANKDELLVNNKDGINALDYGIAANLTYMLSKQRNGKGINIQLRYYKGLADVLSNTSGSNYDVVSLNLEFPFISDDVASKNK
jgi:Outer membrane protein beta-barrel domain